MRAPFNSHCTIFAGPGTATPGVPRAFDVPCRLVPDPLFIDVDPPLSASTHYLTIDESAPLGPAVTDLDDGAYKLDYAKADRIEVDSHPDDVWVVLRTEICAGKPPAPYWRASLARDEGGGGTDPVEPGTECGTAPEIMIDQIIEGLTPPDARHFWWKITAPGSGTYSLVISTIVSGEHAVINVYSGNDCTTKYQEVGRRIVSCAEFALPGFTGGANIYVQCATNPAGYSTPLVFMIKSGACP